MNYRFKMRLLGIMAIILLCIGATVRTFQNDTFYIIKLGDYIVHHGIDLVDHYNWITNLTYTYPHWLYDVVIYFIYANCGYFGVYVSTIFFFILLILIIYVVHLKTHGSEFLALFVALISIACLYNFATARSQLVTAPLFLLEVYFIERLVATGRWRYIFYLVLISLLVANLHATIWMFCFILYFPFIGEVVVSKIKDLKFFRGKLSEVRDSKLVIEKVSHVRLLLISFGLSFIMGIFTPSRICYSYIFRIMLGDSQSYIIEHAPLVVIEQPIFIILAMLLLAILIFTNTKIYLRELFMIGGITFMSLVSFRHIAFFYIIGVFYLANISIRCLKNKRDNTLDLLGQLIVGNKFTYCLLFLVVIVASASKFQENSKLDYVSKKEYPVEAVSFIKELDVSNLRLYNEYNVGSYLLFQDIPVFIDSRCDLYLSEFNGLDYSIFDDAMEMVYHYEEKFQFYQVTHVLLSKDAIFSKILKKDLEYKEIYQDQNFILFERLEG